MARAFIEEVGGDGVLVGSVVADRYHVAGVLGQGSTGTVFGVEQVQFGRRAALKVLRPRSASADVVHRVFHGDARAAWSVVHPCLSDVFDVGTLPDGSPFFVSEYLEGETLAKRIARDRMSLAAAVDVMMQILSAVAAVHERALLVRDLRPQNVFLSHRRGCRPIAKILDLGLGRLTPLEAVAEQWEADPVAASVAFPHPYYLSPERTRSEHGIDHASDLFVAGVIFYEMLTGNRPFQASSYNGLLLQIAQSNPTPVSETRDHSLAELDAFVARSLSGNPRNRFTTAKEMQDELRRIFESSKRGGSAVRESTAILAASANPAAGFGNPSGLMPSMAPSGAHPSHASAQPLAPPAPPQRDRSERGLGAPSGSFRAAPVSSSSSSSPLASSTMFDPPESPRDQTLNTEAPTATNTERPDLDESYGEEMETDRKFFDAAPYRDPASSSRMQAASSLRGAAVPPMPSMPSKPKSANPKPAHPMKTQSTAQAFTPPRIPPIDGDDFEEEPTEARNQIYDPEKTGAPPVPEEETQQLQMTPEIRAKIEAHYAAGQAAQAPVRPPMNSELDSIPPPTKRLDNK